MTMKNQTKKLIVGLIANFIARRITAKLMNKDEDKGKEKVTSK